MLCNPKYQSISIDSFNCLIVYLFKRKILCLSSISIFFYDVVSISVRIISIFLCYCCFLCYCFKISIGLYLFLLLFFIFIFIIIINNIFIIFIIIFIKNGSKIINITKLLTKLFSKNNFLFANK